MRRASTWTAAFLIPVLAWGMATLALGPREEEPVPPELNATFAAVPSPLLSPGSGTLRLSFQVPTGYHIFGGESLSVTPSGPPGVTFGKPAYPKGKIEEDLEVLRGRVLIDVPVTLPGGQGSSLKGSLVLDWQACQDFGQKVCFLPTQDTIPFEVPVAGSGQAAPTTIPPAVSTVLPPPPPAAGLPPARELKEAGRFTGYKGPDDFLDWLGESTGQGAPEDALLSRFSKAAKDNIPLALAIAFVFGILSSLLPCVYPVIPITVAYIGSRSEGRGRFHGFALSWAFVLGLALVYAALGAVSAKAGQSFGALTQTPWVGIPVAALFFVLALSMFNLFELKLPSVFANRIEQTKHRGRGRGFVGAFLIGALSGLVASPCIGPLLVAILLVVAATGSAVLGFLYLLAFALGMGLLFVVIGTFWGILASLPKSGAWMDGLRVFFGAVILGAAFYFAGLFMPRPVFTAVGLLALFAVALFLLFGGKRHFFPVPWRAVGILLSSAALALVFLFLPGGASKEGGVPWRTDLEAALRDAASQGKPALLDFRADWCVACLELEEKTWPEAGVQKALERLVPVKLDVTKNTPENRALQQRYGVKGLPTVILLSPAGQSPAPAAAAPGS